MIETGCFKELNVFGPNLTATPDLVVDAVVEKENDEGCFPFKRKVSLFSKTAFSLLWFQHFHTSFVSFRKKFHREQDPYPFQQNTWSQFKLPAVAKVDFRSSQYSPMWMVIYCYVLHFAFAFVRLNGSNLGKNKKVEVL